MHLIAFIVGLVLWLAGPSLAAATPIKARVEAPAEKPPASQIVLESPIVDFASGSNNSLATSWDPSDKLMEDGGIGCDMGTVSSKISPDNNYLTLYYDRMEAEAGYTVRGKRRAFCRVNITITAPGWTFDIANIDYKGQFKLDQGVKANLKTKYKFIGVKGRVSTTIPECSWLSSLLTRSSPK